MRGFWGAVTLVLAGVIVADLVANADGVSAAGKQLNSILGTTFSGMLGGQKVQGGSGSQS